MMHAGGAFCVLASLPKPQAVLPVFLEDPVEVLAGAGHSRMPSAEGTPQVLHSTRREVPFFPARAWCTATKAQRMQVNAITLRGHFPMDIDALNIRGVACGFLP